MNGRDGSELDGRIHTVASEGISRRSFLKTALVAGAAIGGIGAIGGIATACGGDESSTATTLAAMTGSEVPTTAVSAGPEMGREVKLGFVSPLTGPASAFGIPDSYVKDKWTKAVADGMVFGDGKKHPVTIVLRDSQSDTNRAAQVAGDLVQNDGIDMMMVCSSPDTVNPVADQCEALGMPCVSTDSPMEPYYYGRGATDEKPFKWTYHAFWGFWENYLLSEGLWQQIPNSKIVGGVWSNEVDGESRRQAMTPFCKDHGYTLIDGGAYQPGQEDYTTMINSFKREGVEVLSFLGNPPDLDNFWKQCAQQGFKPKIADVSKATLFPTAMEAIGELAYGLAGQHWWHPTMPWKSSLSGETCQELALDFETTTGFQWTQPLMHYMVFEWVVDVLNRVGNIDDKEEIVSAVASTKMADSMAGPIDFTLPVKPGSLHIVPNVVGTPVFSAQWVKGKEQRSWSTKLWPFDLKVVGNEAAPQMAIQGPLEPLS